MSLNDDLAALVEKSRQRFSRLSATAGERLFSPRATRASSKPSVIFKSPLPGKPEALPHDDGVGVSGELSLSSGVSGGVGDLSLFVLSPD